MYMNRIGEKILIDTAAIPMTHSDSMKKAAKNFPYQIAYANYSLKATINFKIVITAQSNAATIMI